MQNMYNSTGTLKIATVIAVDLRRKICKCLSDTGEILGEVRWVVPMGGTDGNGMSVHPIENSRVLVDTASGFPFIIGSIPNDGTDEVRRPNIGRQDVDEEDIADYSIVDMGDLIRDPGTPRDQRPGDNLFTSDGGGILGLLQSGTAVIKSSPLAQIISSRFGDLVRVVSRNWEHYTELDSDVKASIRGKTFRIRDLFRSPDRARESIERDEDGNIVEPEEPFVEKPSMVHYEGDVMWGETIGRTYASYKEADFPTEPLIPEDEKLIDKKYLFTYTEEGEQQQTRVDWFDDEGSEYTKIELMPVPEDGPQYYEHSLSNSDEYTKFLVTTADGDIYYERSLHAESSVYRFSLTDGDGETFYNRSQDSSSEIIDYEFPSTESTSKSESSAAEFKHSVLGGDKTSWLMNEEKFRWDVDSGKVFIEGDKDKVVVNVDSKVVITCNADGNLTVTNTGDTSITTDGNLSVTASDTTFDLANCTFNTSGTTTFNSGGNFSVTAPVIALN